jgi:hypothetical protein
VRFGKASGTESFSRVCGWPSTMTGCRGGQPLGAVLCCTNGRTVTSEFTGTVGRGFPGESEREIPFQSVHRPGQVSRTRHISIGFPLSHTHNKRASEHIHFQGRSGLGVFC